MMLMLFNRTTAWSYETDVYFKATTVEGVEVTYCIPAWSDHYCSVSGQASDTGLMPPAAINTATSGSITIPQEVCYQGKWYGVTSIGMNAFNSCYNLTSVSLPESISGIEMSAFYYCRNMKTITLPKKVTHNYYWSDDDTFFIGQEAFYMCTSLTEIELPEGVKELPYDVFGSCNSLKSVSLPSTLTTIDYSAFSGCPSLTTLTVKAAVPPTVDASTFDDCSGITLYVPKGSKNAYAEADVWKNFKEIVEDISLLIISFADANVKQLCVANWDTNGDGELDGEEAAAVTNLGSVFTWSSDNETPYNIQSFDELKYFTGLTSIGEDAFSGCSLMKTLTLPSTVTNIGHSAFYGCRSLLSIAFPESLTAIGGQSFYGCSSLTSFNVPASVNDIGVCPIENCPKITSITVASDNPYYDSREGCNAIIRTNNNMLIAGCKNSFIPNSVTTIAGGAFEECDGLTSIVIPASVITISGSAFYDCSSLETITISNGVQTIGTRAFYGCKKLGSLTIPASVTNINDYAFQGCTGLTTIAVAVGNSVYDSREDCNAIIHTASNTLIQGSQNAFIPNDVTGIGQNAFAGLKNITSLDIPESVTSIGAWAFSNCSDLALVIIPSGVTIIGQAAFYGCNSLEVVKSKITTPFFIAEMVFQYYNSTTKKTEFTAAKLQVPYGCKAAYEATDYWNKFSLIEEESKCATPIISYKEGKLHFECETEGVTYHYNVSCPEGSSSTGNDVLISTSYTITVYASKNGFADSELATKDIDVRGLKGDVNEDGVVSITDAVSVVNIILGGGE